MGHEITAQEARRIVLQSLESLERAGVAQLPKPKRRGAMNVTTVAAMAPVSATRVEAPQGPRQAAQDHPPFAVEAKQGSDDEQPLNDTKGAELGDKQGANAGAPAKRVGSPTVEQSKIENPRSKIDSDRVAALTVVRQDVAACVRCQQLATTRKQTVFGVGDPCARLCFLGEAPGADEDQQGEPFVGKAGQLLNKIIEACTLRRDQVYILNMLKCRPPGNRNPEPDELTNCRSFLDRQLEIIQPEFICCLGAVAARALLETEAAIGKLRGRFYRHGEIRVLCTYHPAYLLRNPAAKRDVWEDMQLLMREMGIALPQKPS